MNQSIYESVPIHALPPGTKIKTKYRINNIEADYEARVGHTIFHGIDSGYIKVTKLEGDHAGNVVLMHPTAKVLVVSDSTWFCSRTKKIKQIFDALEEKRKPTHENAYKVSRETVGSVVDSVDAVLKELNDVFDNNSSLSRVIMIYIVNHLLAWYSTRARLKSEEAEKRKKERKAKKLTTSPSRPKQRG